MFKILLKQLLPLFVFLGLVNQANAQVLVNSAVTAAQMVQALVGTGISYSNPILTCADSAKGLYTVVSSNLGIGDGILLTTGTANTNGTAIGANGPQSLFAANVNGTPGNSELTNLSGVPTFDACTLEFDFVPDGDSLLFNYVFGSEEYDAFSCSSYNDVFAFFLSGPGITGAPNIALIPGTTIPVAINSTTNPAITQPGSLTLCQAMGPGSPFSQYYNDNSNGQTITYYGLTTVLTARAAVIPCTTYHIKLAIADGSDGTLDSGVFLAANSFRSTNIKLNLNSSLGSKYDYLVEGCTYASVSVKRSTAFPISQTIHLGYTGSATRNVDYAPVPDSIIIPANDTVASFVITPYQDNIPEGVETVTVNVLNPCNGNIIDSLTFKIYDYLPDTLLSVDTAICQGKAARLDVIRDSDFVWYWRSVPASNILNYHSMSTLAYPDTTTTYYVSASYNGCVTDTTGFTVTVEPQPQVNVTPHEISFCLREPYQIMANVGPSYFSNYTYAWSPGFGLDDPSVLSPNFFVNTPGTYHYVLTAQTPLGCSGSDTVNIITRPAVHLYDVSNDTTVEYGSVIQLFANGADYYTWTPDKYLDFPNINSPKYNALDSVTLELIGMNQWGCKDTAHVHIDLDYSMFETIPNAFSPNGDGRNDIFRVTHIRYQRIIEFKIFNRWGQQVFSDTGNNAGWDGTYNGEPADVGVYNYLIRIVTPEGKQRVYKGNVSLIR